MASLTVRQLDEKLKKLLRLRAAKNGRSVEDEVRTILRSAAADPDAFAPPPTRRAKPQSRGRYDDPHDPAHHRRRHRGLQIARPDPPAARARHRGARGDDRGGAEVHHAAIGRRDRRRASVHGSVRRAIGVRRRPYPARPRSEPDRGGARHRRPDGEDGERPGRRPRLCGAARHRQDDRAGARNESVDVEQQGDAAKHRATRRRSASFWSVPTPARWRSAAKPASGGWRSRSKSSRRFKRSLLAVRDALAGVRMLVTSGPTHEPIDPVRYIANRSSGKQGHAIAEAAASAGAEVTLVSGPVNVPDPRGVNIVKVEVRPRHARRGRKSAPRRRRGVRRRGRGLANRDQQRREDQEDRQGARPSFRSSKIPTSCRPWRISNRTGRSS